MIASYCAVERGAAACAPLRQQGAADAATRRPYPAPLCACAGRRRNRSCRSAYSPRVLRRSTARAIGWTTGSPFQFEVGMHDGAWGVVGFLCIWIGGMFWLATGLGWSLFMLGAAYGHIRQTVIKGDYAPYNFLTIFSDAFIAIWLLVFPWLYWRRAASGGARVGRDRLPQGPRSPIYSPREVGGRRVPRQPGQVRKEAALTRVSRVARPASHLP